MSTGMSRVCCDNSGGASIIHQASRTLNNDEIKALPSNPRPTIVGAPSATRIVIPAGGYWESDFTAGAYLSANASWQFLLGGVEVSNPVNASPVLNSAIARNGSIGIPFMSIGGGDFTGIILSGAFGGVAPNALAGQPLDFGDDYDGVSDYTNGHASNTLIVCAMFLVWDMSLKRFLTTDESGWNESTRTFS